MNGLYEYYIIIYIQTVGSNLAQTKKKNSISPPFYNDVGFVSLLPFDNSRIRNRIYAVKSTFTNEHTFTHIR